MKNEFEIVEHKYISGFRIFIVDLLYRTPHLHRDYELCMILNGSVKIYSSGAVYQAEQGDLIMFNPFQVHELSAPAPVLILSLQMSQDFFSDYFPQLSGIWFCTDTRKTDSSDQAADLGKKLLKLGITYFRKEMFYELACASLLNEILHASLQVLSWKKITPEHRREQISREKRIHELTEKIDQRCSEKLLLSDLANEMGISLFYLSHFFSDNFGISFQQYLSRVRCEKARRQLLLTDLSLLTISIACGFSDPKYFNRAFQKQYGMTPKEYRKNFTNEEIPMQQSSMLTTQEFLSDEASLILLERSTDLEAGLS